MIETLKALVRIQQIDRKLPKWLPGCLLLVVIAFIAQELGKSFPLLGGVIIAILLGILIRNGLAVHAIYDEGIQFTLKKILKLAIILLGASLSLAQIAATGLQALLIIFVVVCLGIGMMIWIGKMMKIEAPLSLLIGVGTSICGATAIAATKGIIEAKENQTAYAISTIFFLNLLATFLYPWIGYAFQMSQSMFGVWVGTAVHDTSSVVALGYMYGNEAGETATTVKLVRTLFLLPIVLLISFWMNRQAPKKEKKSWTKQVATTFPWFILGFLALSLLNSAGWVDASVREGLLSTAKFLILMVMVGVGLQVDWRKLVTLGSKPLLAGLIVSILVSITSLLLIMVLI